MTRPTPKTAVKLAAAAALHHGVEEPARRWMRRMLDARRPGPPSAPPHARGAANAPVPVQVLGPAGP